ncbi:MAG: arginine--tRNA ligase [Phycisphaerae bacterium]|nr:arginine--tRNA ligase [Phycisphaerae bacterium]
MKSPAELLNNLFAEALRAAFGEAGRDVDPLIRPATDPRFGDYQSNVAMGLARTLGRRPRDIAQALIDALGVGRADARVSYLIEPPEIAGPGFINLRLRREFLEAALSSVPPAPGGAEDVDLAELPADRLGIEPVDESLRRTVVIDYSSPNVAKEMHVGHLRSTIIGDTIARVLAFEGHRVVRQNHLGDWGTQFGMVILGMWHLCKAERRGEPEDWSERRLSELAAARSAGGDALRAYLTRLRDEHQAELDRDPAGVEFAAFLRSFAPRLVRLLPAYQFVNAVESAAEDFDLTVVDRQNNKQVKFSAVSNHVVAMLQRGGSADDQERQAWQLAIRASLEACGAIYRRLCVLLTEGDVRGESFFHDMLPGIVEELRLSLPARGADEAAATGSTGEWVRAVCRDDGGAVCVFLETPDGTPRFKGPDGEPLPLIVRKSDGAYLYATTDLAAALYRMSDNRRRPIPLRSASLRAALAARDPHHGGLGGDRVLYVVGMPQKLHFEMLFATIEALGWTRAGEPAAPRVRLEHVAFGSVLGEDRKPYRARSGESVRLKDLLDEAVARARRLVEENDARRGDDAGQAPLSDAEKDAIAEAVGIGSVKYADLCQNRGSDYVFSWDKMLAMQGNTAPYLMYAHARIRSIFRKGAATCDDAPIVLEHAAERALGMRILQFGETLSAVSTTLLPNLLCDYLYELAGAFMAFYENCPVLRAPDEETRVARLRLCDLAARTLKLGLGLLGIRALQRM